VKPGVVIFFLFPYLPSSFRRHPLLQFFKPVHYDALVRKVLTDFRHATLPEKTYMLLGCT